MAGEAVAIEDVVPQHEGTGISVHEVCPIIERTCKAIRLRLRRIREMDAEILSIFKQPLEVRSILRRRDDEDIPDACQHERGQRIVDHRLVIDRQQLLAGHSCQRIQTRTRTAGQNNPLHSIAPSLPFARRDVQPDFPEDVPRSPVRRRKALLAVLYEPIRRRRSSRVLHPRPLRMRP